MGSCFDPLSLRGGRFQPGIHTTPNVPETSGSADDQPSEPPSHPNHKSPLFALVIGIDVYTEGDTLRGAVADAKAIKQYLKTELQTSEDHIVTLYNDKATRNAIIQAFKNLRNDRRINNGDAIVIFYAGHGGELPTPRGWGPQKNIQCIIPQDDGVSGTHPIPDRTIGALIEDIAKAKGDNITVIFDCCHSASGARDRDKGYVPRTVKLDSCSIPENLDRDIWGGRDGSISHGFAYHGLRSHVFLAACGEKERAYEHEGRGDFTSALLEKLSSCAVNIITYAELFTGIQLDRQHPQCEGVHRNRFLFNGRVSVGRQVYYPVEPGSDKRVVHAGWVHGVSHGAEFILYTDKKHEIHVVKVNDSVEDFKTTVTIPSRITNVSFAKLRRIGEVLLYLAPRGNYSALEETLRQIDRNSTNGHLFRLVGAEEAKLEVGMEGNRIILKVLDPRVKRFGLTRLPHEATRKNLTRVLGAAEHYFWYLDLKSKDDRPGVRRKVAVDFHLLKEEDDEDGILSYSPAGPGLCRKDSNSDKLDVIDFVVDPNALYGIKITNNTQRDLYLNVFLFNNSSLSITPWYTQSSAGYPEAPLKQGEIFTIGYGDGGASPLSYSLQPGQDVDVGYLKIFFATLPIDLSHIEQSSPFLNLKPLPQGDRQVSGAHHGSARDGGQPAVSVQRITRDIWYTIVIPVVQRRGSSG